MKFKQACYLFLIILFFGCKNRYSDDPRDLSIFERITHERTDYDVMEEFIDSLMLRMTLVEKIGQMTQLNEDFYGIDAVTALGKDVQAPLIDSAKLANIIKEYQVGSFLTGETRTAMEWYEVINRLQEINMIHSNNRIPVIIGTNYIHGTNYLFEGTVFPHQVNLGATFDSQFARKMGEFTTHEAAHLGNHWNFAPVLDLGINKFSPRVYETFGEDHYLASVMGAEYIKGLQETNVGLYKMAACAKHFIGYSLPISGWDRTPVEISHQRLQEVLIPPFKSAIDAGVMTIMANSGEINGKPIHASYYYLTTILRDQLGFEGVLITDYQDIIKLHEEHKITENEKESTYRAIIAGIDISMTPTTVEYCTYLRELVEEGRIPEERIDLSVRRILRLKYRLGVFENPYPSDRFLNEIGSEEIREMALNAAAESIVLMKNERNVLPITRPGRLVVVGANANSKMALCGGWTYTWQGNDETGYSDSVKTVVQALKEEYENTRIVQTDARGLRWHANLADAVVVVTGEQPYAEGWGNIDDLYLPEEELELIKIAVSTNKPVILILIEGRPRIIGDLFDECDAVLFAGLPGMYGGEAIAGIMKGRFNPSAKMSITYPYKAGHTIPYNHKHMEYSQLNTYNPDIQRYTIGEFGEGESYTSFTYSDLTFSDTVINEEGIINASVIVTNTGQREGKEAVLWFISDEVASTTRPVRQLKHFDKQFLLPGEFKEHTFTIEPYDHLSFPDENGKKILEPGYFTVWVGSLKKRFKLEITE